MMDEAVRERRADDLRERAEEVLAKRGGRKAPSTADIEALVHDFQVYQIELELQNEELRHAQEELVRSRNEYARLYDLAPVGYISLDAGNIIRRANGTFIEMLAGNPSLLLDHSLLGLVAPPDRMACERFLAQCSGTRGTHLHEVSLFRGDNSRLRAQLEARSIEEGGLFIAVSDVSARYEAETIARLARERYEAQFRAFPVPMLVFRDEGGVFRAADFNRAAEEAAHGRLRDRLGRPASELFPGQPDIPADLAACSATRQTLQRETCLGLFRFEEDCLFRLTYACVPPDLVVLHAEDISERIKLEAERAKAQRLESLGVLAGGVAHDFNNLLMGILGNLSLARMSLDPQHEAAALLSETEDACGRARDLTQQLLTFAKGGAPLRQPVDLGPVMRRAIDFALRGSSTKVEYDIEEELMPVHGDAGQINQALSNLVLNAREAMEDAGVVAVTARNEKRGHGPAPLREQGQPADPFVLVQISDEGPGIDEAHLGKVFDPYFTTKPQGSGLGLAVVYSVVKNHEGAVSVDSGAEGTTFSLWWPASSGPVPTGTDALTVPGEQGGRRVLVVDDEATVRRVAARMLERLGYRCDAVETGEEGVRAYEQCLSEGQPYDVVLMDLTIPGGMGGKQAVRELHKLDPTVRAVVSSGYSNDPVMAEHTAHGFRAAVRKPFDMKELASVLDAVLREPS